MLIDVTRLIARTLKSRLPTGVDRVSLAYVEHFRSRAVALVRLPGRWIELGRPESGRVFDALLHRGHGSARALAWAVARSYVCRWGSARPASVLVNTGHSGLDHPSYALEVRRRRLQPLYFLHDLIPMTHPEYCRPGESARHRRRLQAMLETGAGLVVNSRATRAALENYARAQGWRVPSCIVAPVAPTRLPRPAATAPLPDPYFVMLGTIEPRKNHSMLLQLWRQLIDELGAGAPRLAVIGQRGWECEHVVDLLERCPALRGFVVEKPRCDDAELATWLRHARALLFPSFAEGFGIPLVEALTLGVPVIASNLPVFRELAGAIPDYLDPLDGAGWKRTILDYLHPDGERCRLQHERMRGYAATTWADHFAAVEAMVEPWFRGRSQLRAPAEWADAASH